MIFADYIDIEPVIDCTDDQLPGDVMGYWCNGHVNIEQFFTCAVVEYEDQFLDDDDDPCDILGDSIPFAIFNIKHLWYRYPTGKEQEDHGMDSMQFIFAKDNEPKDGYQPITYLEFDY